MNIRERIGRWLLRDSGTRNPEQWFLDWASGGSRSAAGVPITERTALQEAACMSCVLIRSGDLAKCQIHAYTIAEDGQQLIMENHAAERLLRQPNFLPDGSPWQTSLEFVEQMQIALLLKSNAYAVILRNGRAEPIALVPICPSQVSVYETPEGEVYYQVGRQTQLERALLRDMPQYIPAADMLHVRGATLNGMSGLARIWMARDTIGLGLAMDRTAGKLFGNGAHPTIVLTTEQNLTDASEKRAREAFRNKNQGIENTGEMLLIGGGIKPVPVQMNMMDAQFAEIRNRLYETIAMIFEVPKHRLGMTDQGDPLKTHQMYLNNTIAQDARRLQSKLNQLWGFDGIKTFVEFDLDEFNLADPATRTETGRVAILGGQITPNEWRRREGLGPKPGGDDLYRPSNVVPATTPAMAAGSGPGSDTTGKPAPGGDGDPHGNPGKSTEPGDERLLN